MVEALGGYCRPIIRWQCMIPNDLRKGTVNGKGILVGGEISEYENAQRIIWWILAAAGVGIAYAPFGDWTFGWILAAVGIALGLAAEFRAWRARRSRRWLEIRPHGFVLSSRAETCEYDDRDVHALSCTQRPNVVNGKHEGVVRRLHVWLRGELRPVVMENCLTDGVADPLQPLIDRLLEAAVERAEETLRAGGAVEGENWRLDGTALYVGHDAPILLSEISSVDQFGGSLCVWRRGESNPDFKTPLGSRNDVVLLRLLKARMTEHSQAAPTESDDHGDLGRLLFQRRKGYIPASILLGIGAIFAAVAFFTPDPIILLLVGGVFAGVGGVMLLSFGRTFRCHQRGVFVSGLLLRRTLRYADVDAFEYEATQIYQNYSYQGTRLSLTFVPAAGSDGRVVSFETMYRAADADLDRLRDFISEIVARRLRERFERDGSVIWTSTLALLADGLEYQPSRLFGKSQPRIIPYADCERLEFKDGIFKVFSPGADKPFATEKTSVQNFFPGYLLLLELTRKEP